MEICRAIQHLVAARLGISPDEVNPTERFHRLGIDSLAATSILVSLGGRLGRALPPTLAWQFPTAQTLARHLGGEGDQGSGVTHEALPVLRDEPIAVVGLACRVPGAADPGAFWALLRDGVDAIREVPKDRWDVDALFDPDLASPGKTSTRWAGLLDDVASFDAAFFGISPREATQVDPQQRLMLELSWEALEDAGVDATTLKGSRTGVFFGAMWMDYSRLPGATVDRIGLHTATGQDLSIIPARVSYTLGLVGPSIAVNTACSSSLVAVHLARQSLLRGESRLALAGGVNLLLSEESTIVMSKFGAMAPDGRSKAFDARANGYVRGEGGGVVALKRLSDAIADGDRIYCTIRGSALNNDGFSNGLTAPSPQAQEAVIRDACADAGVLPSEVQYVEAHGTGTMLGDPIEAGALGAALGKGRTADRPLRIGSVKTNIGHLEAAAGMAGLIKVVLSMQHGQLPPSLHYRQPNPHIDFERLRLRVQEVLEPWAAESGRRVAGVSSFGFGGTNAHVVLEETASPAIRSVRLAAPASPQLVADAKALAEALRTSTSTLETVAEPSDVERKPHRLAVAARSTEELASQLEAFALGQPLPGLTHGTAIASRRQVVLVFGGQGSQWLGMGRALLRDDPAGRAALTRCDAALRGFVEWSLVERLQRGDATLLDDTAFVQAAIFAMQVALSEALRARGLQFEAVVGQSVGEVAAAHIAGALSLEDATRVICVRSELVDQVSGGRMAVVGLSLAAASAAIAPYGDRLSIAIAAAPDSTVVAGEHDAVDSLRAELEPRGVAVRQIRINYASHSRQMDPLLPELRKRLSSIRPRDCTVAFWSTVVGGPLPGRSLDAAYWVRNLREPVLFWPTLQRLTSEGAAVFVEVDPHPVLSQFIKQSISSARGATAVVSCAARDEAESSTLLEAVGQLFVAGCVVRTEPPSRSAELVVLSARTEGALRSMADRLREHMESHPELSVGDVAYSLVTTRSAMEQRLALSVGTRGALLEALAAVSEGETPAGAARGEVLGSGGKVAWLFGGQGSQTLGMGRELYGSWPVFHEALEAAWSALDEHLDRPLRGVMWAEAGSAEAGLLGQTGYTQPALFALEWALSALWRSWGVEPELLCGHSVGEIVAACVAGVMSMGEGARLVCARGRLMQGLPVGGAMVSVEASEGQVAAAVAAYASTVSIAAINGPSSVVISGDESPVEAIASYFASRGIRTQRLSVSHAFHSARMDPMLGEFARVAESIAYRPAARGLVSNLSGSLAGGEESTPGYWVRHAREAVRFGDGVEAMRVAGAECFLEIGPKSTLLGLVRGCVGEASVQLVPSLRPGRSESESVLESLGGWFARGGRVGWDSVLAPGSQRVSLPTYPWQRERYWIELSSARTAGGMATGHPLLGVRIGRAGADAAYETLLSWSEPSWLSEHRVGGEVVVPGAALAELVRAAGEEHGGGAPCEVTGLVLQLPLVVGESGSRVQVLLCEGGTEASVYSQPAHARESLTWTLHATAELGAAPAAARAEDLESMRRRCTEPVDMAATYEAFASMGLEYGPSFQGLRALWRGRGETLAEVSLQPGLAVEGYGMHPALLDAGLQSILVCAGGESLVSAMLPFELGRVVVHRSGAMSAMVHVRLVEASGDGAVADVTLMDRSGAAVAQLDRVRMRRADLESVRAEDRRVSGAMYRLDWQGVEWAAGPRSLGDRWAVVAWGEGGQAQSMVEELRTRGASGEVVSIDGLKRGVSVDHVLCVWGEGADASAATAMAGAGLSVAQALVSSKSSARLWWVTRGSMSVSGEPVSASASSVWGLGRTVMQEHPELRCTLVDVQAGGSVSEALAREVSAGDEESQVAWRGEHRHVARLVRAVATSGSPARALRVDGTVLVTGGLGALGLQVSRGLAARGVKHLVLTGRRGADTPGARKAVLELESLGARVTVVAVDVADREALSQVVSQVPPEWPLRGVVHAAGVLDDGVLSEQTAERFARVIRPKAHGAWNLHLLTEALDLDIFVLFSSVTGTLGSAGQSGYTAANAYLDALAAHRRARGLPGVSLAWGAWAERGLAAALDANLKARLERQGLGMISMSLGLELFDQALARPEAHLVLAPLDLRTVAKALGAWVPPLWRTLVRVPPVRAAGAKGSWSREVAALPVDKRAEAVTHAVRVEVARVLGIARGASAVAEDKAFKDLGLDSLMAVELRNALGRRAAVTLPATLAFDQPTPSAIAKYLLAEVLSTEDVDPIETTGSVKAVVRALSTLSDEQWRDERLLDLIQRKLARKRAENGVHAVPDDLTDLLKLVDHL